MEGTHYARWEDVPADAWHWPNFTPREMACSCCGALLLVPAAMDRLQSARSRYGKAIRVVSGYRCPDYNVKLGGTMDGPHTTGCAIDPKPALDTAQELAAMEDAFFRGGVLGRGKGKKEGVEYIHFDWSERHGHRSWYYGT